ncbi:MAG: hypothetical protein H6865_07370 [Rhodospirillales bacterium]|nr:hypothetical protein [Alphaproteobacteria bacterium]MCB9987433.1 hypothetical protein [Rhodospirillales bacterium]USO07585.1 MAG: hypothetical protein H6866_09285 [Rhodospirillales bacterium]
MAAILSTASADAKGLKPRTQPAADEDSMGMGRLARQWENDFIALEGGAANQPRLKLDADTLARIDVDRRCGPRYDIAEIMLEKQDPKLVAVFENAAQCAHAILAENHNAAIADAIFDMGMQYTVVAENARAGYWRDAQRAFARQP